MAMDAASRLAPAVPYSGGTRALRTVVRTRGHLVEIHVAATSRLGALLEAQWPGAKAVLAGVESPMSLGFLTRYPSPASAATWVRSRWQDFRYPRRSRRGRSPRTSAELPRSRYEK